MDAHLFSLARVRDEFSKSIPDGSRRSYQVVAWWLPGLVTVAVILGVLNLSDTNGMAIATGIITFAALIFALAIQMFGMSANLRPADNERNRSDNAATGNLIRELLATVILITAYGGASFVAAILAGTLANGSWPQRIAGALALGLLAHALALTLLALRRTFDFADRLIRQRLNDQVS